MNGLSLLFQLLATHTLPISELAPTTGGCNQGLGEAQGSAQILMTLRHKGLVSTHPGDGLKYCSGAGRGTFTQRIGLPQREVNLLKVTKVTLCYFSLGLEEKRKFNFDSDTSYTRWKLS